MAISTLPAQINKFSQVEGLPFKSVRAIHGGADAYGNVCVFYNSNGYAVYNIIDPAGKVLHEVKFKVSETYQVMSITGNEKSFCVLFTDPSNSNSFGFNVLLIDKGTGEHTVKNDVNPVLGDKEKYAAIFRTFDNIYFLTIQKKPERLFIKSYNGNGDITSVEVKSDMPDLYRHFDDGGFRFIDNTYNFDMEGGVFKKKVYLQNGMLSIVFDRLEFVNAIGEMNTEVLLIDIHSGESVYKKFKTVKNDFFSECSSFIVDSLLFRLTLSPQQLDLSIFDVYSSLLLKQYTVNKTDEFFIKQGPIIKENTDRRIPKPFEMKTTTKALRKIGRGTTSIVARKTDDNTVKLRLGSYIITSKGGRVPMVIPAGPGLPGTVFFINAGNKVIGLGTYIETTLSLPELELKPKPKENISPEKELYDYLRMNADYSQYACYPHPDGLQLAYVDKSDKTVKILHLKVD